MMADWVAVATRGRGLARRRLGLDGARALARSPSLEVAVAALAQTPYGRDVRAGMDLRAVRQAVTATLAWHLRILAGWAPMRGAQRIRVLAAGFEVANVVRALARFEGRPSEEPYDLGALADAWPAIAGATNAREVRERLARSVWGDPGTTTSAGVRSALELTWARRVADSVPEAGAWADGLATLLGARAAAAGVAFVRPNRLRTAAWVLDGVHAATDLWQAQARLWGRIESDARRSVTLGRPSPEAVVRVVALLGVDAWRTCAALEIAARGGGDLVEVLDGVA